MAYIIKTKRSKDVEIREIAGPSLTIGRGAGAQLRLDDVTVDFNHAHIDEVDNTYLLSDDQSSTGTYVNGARAEKAALRHGDRITIGPYVLEVEPGAPGAPLSLELRGPAALSSSQARPDFRSIDYRAAYELYRPYWNKTVVTVILIVASAGFLLAPLKAGVHEFFQPGPLSGGHSMFANQCGRCHQPWRGVSESSCQGCHGSLAAVHQAEQAFTPSCLTCHKEHRKGHSLTRIDDSQCWQCHGDLRTKNGQPSRFEARVTNFSLDHPEFTVPVKGGTPNRRARMSERGARQSDPTTIKLNHQVHLRPNLKGPKGEMQLACKDCHQPAADGTIMLPVTFAAHCQDCHPLEYDSGDLRRVVPHASPELVSAYLRQNSSGQKEQLHAVESQLFQKVCVTCHELGKESALPEVLPAAMPQQWFFHGRFSHQAHRVLECGACHTRAARSTRTRDVLVPGIQICQECHKENPGAWFQQAASAPTECRTCHSYHQKLQPVDWDGPLDLRGMRETDVGAVPGTGRDHSDFSVRRYLRSLAAAFQIKRRDPPP